MELEKDLYEVTSEQQRLNPENIDESGQEKLPQLSFTMEESERRAVMEKFKSKSLDVFDMQLES